MGEMRCLIGQCRGVLVWTFVAPDKEYQLRCRICGFIESSQNSVPHEGVSRYLCFCGASFNLGGLTPDCAARVWCPRCNIVFLTNEGTEDETFLPPRAIVPNVPSGQNPNQCAHCSGPGPFQKAEDGNMYCAECLHIGSLEGSREAEGAGEYRAFTTPATVYEYRHRKNPGEYPALFDAVYFAHIVLSSDEAGESEKAQRVFQAGETYEYRCVSNGMDAEWLKRFVLLRLTPTDKNWTSPTYRESWKKEGFTLDRRTFKFEKKHTVIPVRWKPPGKRRRQNGAPKT